jgi:uncharacterized protein (TIGR00369 family)
VLEGDLEQRILERVSAIPIFHKIGLQVKELSPGVCVAECKHDKSYDGIFESFHGGMLTTVADTIACFAIMTQTGPDIRLATTDLNVRFLAPCLTDVRAVARVIKLGRKICPVQVDLYDRNDRHVAVAQVGYIRLD